MILLVSDIGELKANPKRNASGTVLEAKLDKGRGPVATVLVQDGTLQRRRHLHRRPDRRPRARADRRPRHGRPSRPGRRRRSKCSASPACRSRATSFQVADAAKARQIATFREEQAKTRALGAKGGRLTLESLQAQIAEGGMKELPIIIKADVQGSAEVLADTLTKLTRREGEDPDHPLRRRRGQRVRRAAGVGVERDHHRVQRPARPQRRGDRRARARRHPPALGDLQRHRRDEEGDDGPARSDLQGSADRRRRSARHLQGAEVRHDRRLHGHRRPHHARRRHPGAAAARQRGRSTKARSARCAASRTTSAR